MNIVAALLLKAKLFIIAIPLAIGLTGASMNQAVLYANGGKFPVMLNERAAADPDWKVDEQGYMDDIHCLMTDKTRLNFLADYLNFHVIVMSPGDLLIELGEDLAEYSFLVWMVVIVLQVIREEPKPVKQ